MVYLLSSLRFLDETVRDRESVFEDYLMVNNKIETRYRKQKKEI